ncbi:MAG: prenyltransferase/squalene oxidase repeat-containing protein [bacterium]
MDRRLSLALLLISFLVLSSCKTRETALFNSLDIEEKTMIWGHDGISGQGITTGADGKIIGKNYHHVREAMNRGVNYLLSRQAPEGYWRGPLKTDTSFTAYYIMTMHYLGMVDEVRQQKAVNYILAEQQADGGWSMYPGGASVLFLAVDNYLALKLAGLSADDERMVRARQFILAQGGAESVQKEIKVFLALFDQVPWNEMIQANTDALVHEEFLYRIGYAHTCLIPLMVLYENYYKIRVPEERGIREIFIKDPKEGVIEIPPKKGGKQQEALDYLLERQEVDGNWFGIAMNTMLSVMALKSTRDPSFQGVIEKGMEGIVLIQEETDTMIYQPFCQSPIMDTGYTLQALLAAGIESEHPAVKKAVAYLLSRQSMIYGEWYHNNPEGKPGGWGIEHDNTWMPDNDDTAIVLNAFSMLDDQNLTAIRDSVHRGVDWVISMQNADGGWASFDKNTIHPLDAQNPEGGLIFDFLDVNMTFFFDWSNADVTSRVILALGNLGYQKQKDWSAVISKAIGFIKSQQKPPGYWEGRWGVNCTYGTGQVLQGLAAAGENPAQPYIRRAIKWLKSVQNADGGWGESADSYFDPNYIGVGESTAVQTAHVLDGLLAAGEVSSPQVRRGIEYLINTMLPDGSWRDEEYLGTMLVGYTWGNYELSSTYLPLHTLAKFLNLVEARASNGE